MKLAFLFPGRDATRRDGKEFADNFPIARDTFMEADDALGFPLSRLCFEGPKTNFVSRQHSTRNCHRFDRGAAGLSQRNRRRAGNRGGHSLGEYSALVAAVQLNFPTRRAVRERGRLMQEAVPAGQAPMAALIGLELQQVHEICERSPKTASSRCLRISTRPAKSSSPDMLLPSAARSKSQKSGARRCRSS